jgi:tripartite-type tricarboxylate transporter receptor subunit TctC
LPDVPTVAEQGVPGFEVTAWFGVLAPAQTPQPIVDRLSGEILKIMARPAVIQKMKSLGTDPVAVPPAPFGQHIAREIDRWTAVVNELNVKLD